MAEGIRKCGVEPLLRASTTYRGVPNTDVAIFYGLALGCARILSDWRGAGKKAIYIDLGYWTRRIRSRHDGFHKLVVNDRHPTEYLMARPHTSQRFEQHGVPILPWRKEGRHILVAGMSAKAAAAEGLRANSWEQQTIRRLRALTKRPIVYRPKPNWKAARAIEGSAFDRATPIEGLLRDCHAVVTHHSNVAVEALLAGVPVFCDKGVASLLGSKGLASIEQPLMPEGREQWAHNLAWTQWSVDEMKQGLAFRYLLRDGLI